MAWLSRLRVAVPTVRSLRAPSRSYGAAAAVQFDYGSDDEYYYYGEENQVRDRRFPVPRPGVAGSEPSRGVQWVLMGEPGAKRHVFAERLSKLLEVPHISMGTLVRQELHPKSSLYKQIASSVNEGRLVPEDVVFALLSKRLEEGYCRGETGFILDGIPRTRIQAEILDQIADIDLVVNLKSTEELVRKDMSSETAPRQEYLCNVLSAAVTANAWKENLSAYTEQMKPLEEYYRRQKKLVDVQVSSKPGEAWQGLLAALKLQHRSAASISPKLTV